MRVLITGAGGQLGTDLVAACTAAGDEVHAFDRARLDLSYDPAGASLVFSDVAIDGPALRVRASAKAWLKEFTGAFPNALVGQVAITDLKADPEGLFADPVAISQLRAVCEALPIRIVCSSVKRGSPNSTCTPRLQNRSGESCC